MARVHFAADLLPVILGLPLEYEPGTRWRYSNLDSQLLGLVVERACGTRYAELLERRVWGPLGAGDASVWLDRDGGAAKTYCCVFATARDWARVGELLRNDGRANGKAIVTAQWVARMTSASPPSERYGMHVWLREGGGDVPSHFYLDGKSRQRVYVIPSLEVVIVRLGEDASGWDDLELPRRVAAAASDG
jgi:CubicO group peptidase (beta-lactamase class C family)